jgi:hypothetical protein
MSNLVILVLSEIFKRLSWFSNCLRNCCSVSHIRPSPNWSNFHFCLSTSMATVGMTGSCASGRGGSTSFITIPCSKHLFMVFEFRWCTPSTSSNFTGLLGFSNDVGVSSNAGFSILSGFEFIRILSGFFPDSDRTSVGEQFCLLVCPICLPCKVPIFSLYFCARRVYLHWLKVFCDIFWFRCSRCLDEVVEGNLFIC